MLELVEVWVHRPDERGMLPLVLGVDVRRVCWTREHLVEAGYFHVACVAEVAVEETVDFRRRALCEARVQLADLRMQLGTRSILMHLIRCRVGEGSWGDTASTVIMGVLCSKLIRHLFAGKHGRGSHAGGFWNMGSGRILGIGCITYHLSLLRVRCAGVGCVLRRG